MSQVETQPPSHAASTNIKDTIESFLVAFILAFIFRAFVVEAFVIPTGSMAPTLDGAHMRFRCPDCGYVFDINYSQANGDDMNFPSDAPAPDDVYCPNCGYHIANGPLRNRDGEPVTEVVTDSQGEPHRIGKYPGGTEPEPVHYGDRILVMKYAYLLTPPQRGDVVVFKAPDNPEKYAYTQNYIKRLVGVPGDRLMVLDGDVYIQNGKTPWQIETRPPWVQEALWRIIYDNDYYPQGLPRLDRATPWTQPWIVSDGGGWDLGHNDSDGRTFHFAGQSAGTIHFDSDANVGTQTTNDYLVYDIPANERRVGGVNTPGGDQARNTVNDLKLAFWYQRTGGQDSLKLHLSKRDHDFFAEINNDQVVLLHKHPDGTTTTDAGPVKLADLGLNSAAGLWLEFTNVLYKVTLRINGKEVLVTTPDEYAPDVEELLREYNHHAQGPRPGPPTIEITANNETCLISHLQLHRDIYYTNRDGPVNATPDTPIVLHHRGQPRPEPASTYDDDEYFVMGDNSLISGDARYWTEPINLVHENLIVEGGRVPGRFLLGKAFFVYWPSGYRPIPGWPSLVPDFGDMRFIH
jgi:signal peptidase I